MKELYLLILYYTLQLSTFRNYIQVFFTREGATVFVINNVAEKIKDGRIQVTPMTYRVDFSNSSVDKEIPIRNEES